MFFRTLGLLTVITLTSTLAAASAETTAAAKVRNDERPRIADYLRSIQGKQVISGIHNREPNAQPSLQSDMLVRTVGKHAALWSGDFLFKADDINSRWAMAYECEKQWNAGSIVQIMLHVGPPDQPEATVWNGGVLSDYSDDQWRDLISEGGHLNTLWKHRLDEYAKYLLFLKARGVTVLFRPFHEMNQGKFWWGGRPGPAGTRALYELTHAYLTEKHTLTNLVWIWDMQDMSWDFEAYRPNDRCWEIFAFDVYADGFAKKWYDYVVPIVGERPMIIGECATLPTPAMLEEQPRWSGFMSWSELTFTENTTEQIRATYASPRVITREALPWVADEVSRAR